MSSRYFNEDRIYIQKITKENREELFVEVNQADLQTKIFRPLHNLHKSESIFFPKRFAILGHFKTGKTELGKYIIEKLGNHYKNLISLTINSKRAQYTNADEIDAWIYSQWFLQISHIEQLEFREIVKKRLREFRETRGTEPLAYLDQIYFICGVYKEFLKQYPDAKFVVAIDQANVIQEENQFIPFFEFWRNFQGYWENDNYFSEIPLFIFVIGHWNWMDFAALKNPIGRGVFDTWVRYDYWNNTDIEQMYRKRLEYAIKPEFRQKLLEYFLCSGIIDFLGKKLGQATTQEYLDEFFGTYLQNFLNNPTNITQYEDFLDYIKKETTIQKQFDDSYFQEVEKIFSGTPALDYMPVFRFLSDNQNEKWFEELFSVMEFLYSMNKISYLSKEFTKFKNLSQEFISTKFTYSPLTGMKPEYNPPLFAEHKDIITLNDTYVGCLDAIKNYEPKGPIYLLKRFVKSRRIDHDIFVESKDGHQMTLLLKEIVKFGEDLFNLVQKWVVNKIPNIFYIGKTLEDNDLTPFYKIRYLTYQLRDSYRKNSTNWAIFDGLGRDLAIIILDKTFPMDSGFAQSRVISKLNHLKDEVLSPRNSNLSMAENLVELLTQYSLCVQDLEKAPPPKQNVPKTGGVFTIIDGPNSLGQDYADMLDLKKVAELAHTMDKNAKLVYYSKTGGKDLDVISCLGYKTILRHKDIDSELKNEVREALASTKPPEYILLGVKDSDYASFVKDIRREYSVKVHLVISSTQGLAAALKQAFEPNEIHYLPEKNEIFINPSEKVYKFLSGRENTVIAWDGSGKVCFVDREDENQPRPGEEWICHIKEVKDKCIILSAIKKKS